MNKNRFAVIMAVLFMIVVLTGGWFFLQHVMEKYDVDKKDWSETNTSLHDSSPSFHPHFIA